jgi:hypothetical protein
VMETPASAATSRMVTRLVGIARTLRSRIDAQNVLGYRRPTAAET